MKDPIHHKGNPSQIARVFQHGNTKEHKHDNRHKTVGRVLANFTNQLDAIFLRHIEVGHQQVVILVTDQIKSALAILGGTAGLGYGGLMSITRVVQGAHFAADTVWSLGIMALTAQVLYYFVLRIPARDGTDTSGRLASG